jgi:peroxiredoxin
MIRAFVACFILLLCAGSLGAAGVGSPAPDFEFIRTWNINGSQSRLSDFRGSTVLLETFATWCPHCPGAVPHLRNVQSQYGDRGLKVISVSDETETKIENYLAVNGVNYGVARAFGIGKLFGYTGVPHAWLINASGVVVWQGHSNELTDANISAAFGAVVAPGAAPSTTSEGGGETWWIWLIIGPAVLFAAAMGWFVWSTRDRTARYQTAIYQQPQQATRPPGPPQQYAQPQPYGQQPAQAQYGVPQPFPHQPASYPVQEPYQQMGYNGSPGSTPDTRTVGKPNVLGAHGAYESPGAASKPEPPPIEQRPYLGQNPSDGFPPFDTNRNPQRGR